MRKTILVLAAALVAMLAIPALASATDTALQAKLKGGKEEVPGPGDPNGSGFATVVLDDEANEVCFVLAYNGIDTPTAAHIHRGKKGVAGPVVVPLFTSSPTKANCVGPISRTLLKQIKAKPQDFYVNIHNAAFPAGAIRGQLKKAK